MVKAGTQDSGLFFCASYESKVVVLSCESRKVGPMLEPDSHPRFWSATAANFADSQRLMGGVQNSFSFFGKEVSFFSRFFEMTDRLSLRRAGLLARNGFRFARNPSRVDARDHWIQADFPALISSMSGLAIYHSSRRS